MKEKYLYGQGKVCVIDEQGQTEEYEYQDNIEEVLIIQNLIEELSNRRLDLICDIRINQFKLKTKATKEKSDCDILFIAGIILSLLLLLIGAWFLLPVLVGMGSVMYTSIILPCKKEKMTLENKLRGFTVELQKVEELLKVKTEIFQQLIANKIKTKEVDARECSTVKSVDYKSRLQQLRNLLNLYRQIGVFEKQYLKYYHQGTLEKYLEKEYDDKQLTLIKTYFEGYNR